MPAFRVVAAVRAHPRLLAALGVGVAVAVLAPADLRPVTRALLGWNACVWLYLVLAAWFMAQADHGHVRRVALAQGQSATTVLGVASAASMVSMAGTVLELSAAKVASAAHVPYAAPHIALALATVAGCWLLLPTLFALTYASVYYRTESGEGLVFPGAAASDRPDYVDFLYVAFTISVASQTSDVAISSRPMRRLVLMQSLLSFAFNTTILAFTINLAAGLF